MESGEKAKQPVTPKKHKRPKTEMPAMVNDGSSSNDADDNGHQHQQHEQGGSGKRTRLVWTTELHALFLQALDSLGDDAVPRRILEKMNEKMNLPELSREKIASHLQKHKLSLRSKAEQASSHFPTEEAPAASHPRHSLPQNTRLADVSQAQLDVVQALQAVPDCCLSRSSSIAANLRIVQSIQQQLLGPPIKEEGQAQPAETMHQAPAYSGCSPVYMETSTAATLVAEANTEAVIHMAQADKAENAAEPEEAAAPPCSILERFWRSPGSEASSTSSWDYLSASRAERNRIRSVKSSGNNK